MSVSHSRHVVAACGRRAAADGAVQWAAAWDATTGRVLQKAEARERWRSASWSPWPCRVAVGPEPSMEDAVGALTLREAPIVIRAAPRIGPRAAVSPAV